MKETTRNFTCRTGENSQQFVRSGRFYQQNGHWFFKTREGCDYGPYSSRTECKYAYTDFIDMVAGSEQLGAIPIDFNDEKIKWKVPKINLG